MKEQNIIDIEKVALEFLLAARKEAGMTEAELGQKAFPDSANPWSKIHAMWNMKTPSKKGLRLRLGDFCAMCQALGKNPAQELLLLWNKVDQK